VDGARSIANLLVNRIAEGSIGTESGMDSVAKQFGWSARHIRRIVKREIGVSPLELILTRRLLLAKQLLTETALPVSQVAYSSGFSSLRRFNDAFVGHYGMPPSKLRRRAEHAHIAFTAGAPLVLQLGYRSPFDWPALLAFLRTRAIAGVERVTAGSYHRSVRIGLHDGWISVGDDPERAVLRVELDSALAPVLPALLDRIRHLFDLAMRPDVVAAHLESDPRLSDGVRQHPGLRVPGAFDGFELAVRAILGQQITVRGATTLATRFATCFGDLCATPDPTLTHHFPVVGRIARLDVWEIAELGVIRSRAKAIVALAELVASERLRLEPGSDPLATIAQLVAIPGIGPWTAQYIAMRALRWSDAFPREDVVLRARLGGVSSREADALSRAWRPWRSYATMHLWRMDGHPDADRV
jgi:AraC family transcriptional regulator of adaptative response / DNA-3-methyladenine glycosylase II